MEEGFQAYIDIIRKEFPTEIGNVVVHDSGDDFLIVEINSEWMFRFPRNDASQNAMEKEIQFLSRFKSLCSCPVPYYRYVGVNFGGYSKIQGASLSIELFQTLSQKVRKNIAIQLAQFLTAVHSFPIEEAFGMGITEGWNGHHQNNGGYFLEKVTPLLSLTTRKNSTACMESLLAEEFAGTVIHGDFYIPDHAFFDQNNSQLGIIDFGDVTVYDPAHDFQCIVEIGGDEFFESVMKHYQWEKDTTLLKRSKLRLAARPLFVAGYIFANKIQEQYSTRLARIEAAFG